MKIVILILYFNLLFAQNGIEVNGIGLSKLTMIKASGRVVKKTFSLKKFSKIKIATSVNVTIQIAEKYGYTIEADDNLINLIKVRSLNDTLIVDRKESYTTNNTIKLIIKTKSLNSLFVDGLSTIGLKNLNEKKLYLNFNGNIDLLASTGNVKNLNIKIDGTYEVNLSAIKIENAKVEIAGSGDLKMNVSHKLDVEISDNATLFYSGKAKVFKKVSDNGELKNIL